MRAGVRIAQCLLNVCRITLISNYWLCNSHQSCPCLCCCQIVSTCEERTLLVCGVRNPNVRLLQTSEARVRKFSLVHVQNGKVCAPHRHAL